MTKEVILEKLYGIKKGNIDVNQLINALEMDLLERPIRRLKKDRLVGIKHILEIGRKNGISPAWQQGFKIDGKTVITNGYTMAVLNSDYPPQQACEHRPDQVKTLETLIGAARRCETFKSSTPLPYEELRNIYTVEKARKNKTPTYYIDECKRRWNLQYLLDAMRLFNDPVFYGYNSEKTYVIIAEYGDTDLNEFAVVMGTNQVNEREV